MDFEIDRNTFNGLEVFSGKAGAKSIYSIFNSTRTLEAREMLMKMMQEPSSDINFLVDRRDSIKYFYDKNIQVEITYNVIHKTIYTIW